MLYRNLFIFLLLSTLVLISGLPSSTLAQGGLQQQQLDLPRDPALEKEAKHNLDVAKFYLKRKAYKAVTDRLLEIIYTYPKFSRLDEVLFILADSFLKLDEKSEAAKFYQQLVQDFPDSEYSKDAKKN
ncbi:MAG: outer membrane protein assembly factor BamD [Blastocatellia bacterium]|nr:outer membrane protein assembly factor BamD [Blastocatellia bacterium]